MKPVIIIAIAFVLLIPLVLIGIIGMQESFAEQASGKPAWKTNSEKVCGDRLCSEIQESFTEEVLAPLVGTDEPFELQKSIKEAVFESEKIHVRIFDIEDSRCPSDVQCVWEGQIIVNVNLVVNLEDLGNYKISLNDPLDLSVIEFDEYSLQLIKVEPYPTSTESIHDTDYVATMKFVPKIQESFAEETKTIFIDSHLVDCVSVAPQKCMLVSENPNSEWSYFYGNIKGFTFVEGNTYQLLVKITHIENPPADSSSKKYELLEIITKNSFAEIDSPRKQRANGVAVENIICKEGLGLIFKSSDDSPACVKVKTAEKLIQRGWANP